MIASHRRQLGSTLALLLSLPLTLVGCEGVSSVMDDLQGIAQGPHPDGASESARAGGNDGQLGDNSGAGDSNAAQELHPQRILTVNGSVSVDGRPATPGTPLDLDSRIITGSRGKATLTLGPGNIVAVSPNTTFTLSATYDRKPIIQLSSGGVLQHVSEATSPTVSTEQAATYAKSGAFYVQHRTKQRTTVCACDANLKMTTASVKPTSKDIDATGSNKPHQATELRSQGKRGPRMRKTRKRGHSDDDIAKLRTELAKLEKSGGQSKDNQAKRSQLKGSEGGVPAPVAAPPTP